MKDDYITYLSFSISDHDLPPEELTAIMKCSPTRVLSVGDPLLPGSQRRRKESLWEILTDRNEDVFLGEVLEKFVQQIEPGVRNLRETTVRSWKWNVRLSVVMYAHNRAPSMLLNPRILDILGGLKIALDFDLYPLWEAPPKRPKVGVTSMLTHQNHLLTGIRRGSHAAGQRAFPGGHNEWLKSWAETAVDENLEETGLRTKVQDNRINPYLFVTDTRFETEGKQYTTVWVPCVLEDDVKIDITQRIAPLEPNKCDGWDWLTLHQLFVELLGKEDYTYDDIQNQNPEQAAWLPIKRLLFHANSIELSWPDQLLRQKSPPHDFWRHF